MPPREGAQDALCKGEQLRQHQAAAGGGGVVPLLAPGMPTAAERAKHEVDHCPYQAWCRSCVAGRGKADAHFRGESEEEGVAYVATDHAFMGEKVEDDRMSDRCLPILVHKFCKDRWVTSHVVEHKGADEWATKVAAQDILLSGLKDFVYKSDGERSIVALKHEVVRKLRRDVGPIGVQFEESGVGESQGNAVVERAIWEIESMTRTLVHAAQDFHDVKLELTHPVRIFAVDQRAVKDNRTAYEPRKGRPYKRKLPPFAEAVMYLRVAEKRMRQKFEDRWNTGIYLGLVERSNMVLVGTPNGVVKVNCIKRLPMNQAKDPELLKSIRGYPWRLTPGDVQNEPGEVPTMVASEPVVPEDELPPRLPREREAEVAPRRVYIRRNVELRKYGFTQSCRGCMAAETGHALANQSEACRRRIESAMEADDVERVWVEANRRAREEAGAARQPRAGGFEDLPVGETTTGDDDADVGGAADDTAPLTQGAGSTALGVGGSSSSRRPETRGAGSTAPGDEPEFKRRREASSIVIQGITDELRAFGAVVGPKFMHCATQKAKGIEINQLDLKDAVVSEVFCKNRFSSRAPSFGVHPGFAIDYITGWDFDEPDREAEAFQLRETMRPKLLVGSSECKAWSQLQNLSKDKHLFEAEKRVHSMRHLEAVTQMYHGQVDDLNYFLHEQSDGDEFWNEPSIQRILMRNGVSWIRNYLCAAGLTVDGYTARMATGWLTNSQCIADELAKFQCENRTQPGHHRHEVIIGGPKVTEKTGECQDELVLAILRGLRTQLQADGKMEVNSVGPHFTGHDDEAVDEEDIAKFYDDVTGKMLPGHLVRAARQEEIKFLNTFRVYKKVPEVNAKGKERVSVRWCDVNKGDRDNMVIRSRLVGREFRWKDSFMQGTFAATPPLESLKYVFHWIQTRRRRHGRKAGHQAARAGRIPSHPPAVRELYITLPDEDATPGMVGQLFERSMEHETPLMSGTTSRIPRSVRGIRSG